MQVEIQKRSREALVRVLLTGFTLALGACLPSVHGRCNDRRAERDPETGVCECMPGTKAVDGICVDDLDAAGDVDASGDVDAAEDVDADQPSEPSEDDAEVAEAVDSGSDAGSDAGSLDGGSDAGGDAGPPDSGGDSATVGPIIDPVRRNLGVGEGFACALKASGQPVCWGDGLGRAGGAPAVSFSTLSVGTSHVCGVRSDGFIQCWGGNQSGQSTPPQTGDFVQVAAGHDHTCGLRSDGAVACWGGNSSGQSSPPVRAFSAIAAGNAFTCGLSSGLVSCWGWGDGRTDAPPSVMFDSISLGGVGGCGVRSADQQIQCWQGGTPTLSLKPPEGAFSRVAYGATYICGIRLNGRVECWGDDRVLSPAGTYKEVAPSFSQVFACGITAVDSVSCWGAEASLLPQPPGIQ